MGARMTIKQLLHHWLIIICSLIVCKFGYSTVTVMAAQSFLWTTLSSATALASAQLFFAIINTVDVEIGSGPFTKYFSDLPALYKWESLCVNVGILLDMLTNM